MRDLVVALAGMFGKRYTNRQKTAFINYIRQRAGKLGDAVRVDRQTVGSRQLRNILIGDIDRARIVIAAPYDTPSAAVLPGIHYYPMNARKNRRLDSLDRALALLIALAFAAAYYFFVLLRFIDAAGDARLLAFIGVFPVVFLAAGFTAGFANRNNFSRNTASVIAALEYRKRFPSREVAVALLDYSCCGFRGYKNLARYMGEKKDGKLIIALDCAASEDRLHLHAGKKLAAELKTIADGDAVELHTIDDGELPLSALGLFGKCAVLTGGHREAGETVIDNTRCRRDDDIDLDKLELMVRTIAGITDKI